jgi:histidine triad (HIT) family protein
MMVVEVQRIARAAVKALRPDGVRIAQFNGASAGQTIFHPHFHVIPVYEGEPLGRHGGGKAETAELEVIAAQIRAALG